MVTLTYKINRQKFAKKIPSSFSELTIGQYDLVRGKTLYEAIKILGDIPEQVITQLHPQVLIDLSDVLSFLNEGVFTVQDFKGYEFEDIDNLTSIQFEHWKVQYRKDKSIAYMVALLHSGKYNYGLRMLEVEDVKKLPADIGVYCENFYNLSLEKHFKKYSSLYEKGEDGIEELEKWGMYLTVKHLAGGDILKMPEVWNKQVQEVYTFMLSDKDEREAYELQRNNKSIQEQD